MSSAYYNENDAYAAGWLRNLVAAGHLPAGTVDERSILDVEPEDLHSYTQCHFFAGIGGWPYALQLAGWSVDRPVWTGSCPCQPLSGAARGRTVAADLWPHWQRLIAANRPRTIFGEQVPHKGSWLDRVCDDLEALGYEVGAAVLPAVAIGADHARPRIYFAGHTDSNGQSILRVNGEMARLRRHRSDTGSLAPPYGVPGRMGRLRAYGNAIIPQVAAAFIGAFMECRNEQ
jgi:DNA (cytosine-5)-methyltransferase 1